MKAHLLYFLEFKQGLFALLAGLFFEFGDNGQSVNVSGAGGLTVAVCSNDLGNFSCFELLFRNIQMQYIIDIKKNTP